MFRLSGLFSISMAVVFGTLLFWTSQSVQRAEKNLSQASVVSLNEGESLRVLSAEWDYLNRPQRLEKLAQENFDLDGEKEKGAAIIEGVSSIPEPVIPIIPKMKPKNLMQYVSIPQGKKNNNTLPKPKTIQNADRQAFDRLLSGVAAGGEP